MKRSEDEDMYKLPPSAVQSYDDWRQETQEAKVEFDPEPDYSDDSDDGHGCVKNNSNARRGNGKSGQVRSDPRLHDRQPADDSSQLNVNAPYRMLSQHSTGKALFFEDEEENDKYEFGDNHQPGREAQTDNGIVHLEGNDRHETELSRMDKGVSQKTRNIQTSVKQKTANSFKDAKHRNIKDRLENFSPAEAEKERLAQQIDSEFTYLSTDDLIYEGEEGPDEEGAFPPGRGVPVGNLEGIILPKKLVNPCIDSRERKDLHRELLLNQKMGVDVLHKKSDLKKELDRRKERQKQKEKDEKSKARKTVFEEVLDVQAQKLKRVEAERKKVNDTKSSEPEFLKVHSKIRATKSSNS